MADVVATGLCSNAVRLFPTQAAKLFERLPWAGDRVPTLPRVSGMMRRVHSRKSAMRLRGNVAARCASATWMALDHL
jgi:hypothetical protein